jgi:hypothetical protein
MFLHLAYERYLWILLALAASAAYLGLHHRQESASAGETAAPRVRSATGNGRRAATGRTA